MTAAEFRVAGRFFLAAHGVRRFSLSEIAPIGRRANGIGPALQVPEPVVLKNANLLIETVLMWVRAHDGDAAVHVSSWFRDVAYNKSVGGAPRSMHPLGAAADIVKDGWSPLDLALAIHRTHPSPHLLGIGC